jgi:hypothetical protein
MIGVRDVPPPDVPMDIGESSLLLPLPGQENNSIVFEDRDGSDIKTFTAKSFFYKENDFMTAKASNLNITVFVTAARVAFACTRYEKGGGWRGVGGGAILAIPLNAASMAKAAYQRRGKMLVGQVRYQSLSAVGSGSIPKMFSTTNTLALRWKPKDNSTFQVQLSFDGTVDTAALAAEIARKAATYALAVDPKLDDDKRAKVEPLLEAKPLEHPDKKKLYFHMVGRMYKENETTARYGLG